MVSQAPIRRLDPDALAADLGERRAVLIGATGSGKSTLLSAMADALPTHARAICADPGSPAFGAPTTISRARRREGGWQVEAFDAIASLDAGKYRVSILGAVSRLVRRLDDDPLLVDAPGLYRGGIAREFVAQLVSVVDAQVAIYLVDDAEDAELYSAVQGAGAEVWLVRSSPEASRPSGTDRLRSRTHDWDTFLAGSSTRTFALDRVALVCDLPTSTRELRERVVALAGPGQALHHAGEIVEADDEHITVRTPLDDDAEVDSLLVRDAGRGPDGFLRTRRADSRADDKGVVEVGRRIPFTLRERTSAESLEAPQTVRVGLFEASMLGGPFDDPSLYISLLHHERGMMVDLGESWRLPTRLHHQLSDVFITHAHVDHFAGFVDLLRRRVHVREPCRIWGPRGTSRRVEAMVDAFTWDRLDEHGPAFEIAEFHGDELQTFRVEAGFSALEATGVEPCDGLLVDEPRFRVRSTILDHGTDSLAYRFEETQHFDVRSDRLASPFEPGPWLGELKRLAAMGRDDHILTMSDDSEHTVGSLRSRLLLERPGQSIVYASDLADTDENRRRLVQLAHGADLLVCEAYFADDDHDKARQAGHLTASACAEIAAGAEVGYLLPFHFSARYGDNPEIIYRQILDSFDDVVVPTGFERRLY